MSGPDVLPSVIDSPEAARTAVRVWAARPDRMNRTGELAIMIGRCHSEAHLRFLVDALAEYLGLKPESAEPSFPKIEGSSSKETRLVEPIPVGPDTRELAAPGTEPDTKVERLPTARFEEMKTPVSLPNPFGSPKVHDIKVRETPFTKIVKTSPILKPEDLAPKEAAFQEMAEPKEAPKPEPGPVPAATAEPAPAPAAAPFDPVAFEAPNPIGSEGKVKEEIPSLAPVLALDKAKLPPGVDPEILADVMRVEQCRKIFESTHQQIEVWEVFSLVMLDGDATRQTLEQLLKLHAANEQGEFIEGAMDLFQNLLKVRAKYGKFVRDVRRFVAQLPVGRFGKEHIEMGLGFLVVSARGREAAARWLNEPKRYEAEAANRWEALISTTMRYLTVLAGIKK